MNEMTSSENEKYFSMAIQTVLHHYRNDMMLLNDGERSLPLIQDMSQKILKLAQNFQRITEASLTPAEKGLK